MEKCNWCGKEEEGLEEAGGCDLIPKGLMCCEECLNIPKRVLVT